MQWNRADSGGCQAGTVPGSGVQGAGVSAIRKTACNRLTGVASACSGKANRKSQFTFLTLIYIYLLTHLSYPTKMGASIQEVPQA